MPTLSCLAPSCSIIPLAIHSSYPAPGLGPAETERLETWKPPMPHAHQQARMFVPGLLCNSYRMRLYTEAAEKRQQNPQDNNYAVPRVGNPLHHASYVLRIRRRSSITTYGTFHPNVAAQHLTCHCQYPWRGTFRFFFQLLTPAFRNFQSPFYVPTFHTSQSLRNPLPTSSLPDACAGLLKSRARQSNPITSSSPQKSVYVFLRMRSVAQQYNSMVNRTTYAYP